MKQLSFIYFGVLIQILAIHSLIVPDEIPSLLSVIYSNIPTIKKGTDSRIGWGFRLGNRADFQVLVELGPQTNTQPLGNQPAAQSDSNTSKRNTQNSLSDVLYAQRQKEKNKQEISKTEGGNWLQEWSKGMKQTQDAPIQKVPPNAKPGIAVGEIDAKSVIPEDDATNLMQLYINKKKDRSLKLHIGSDSEEKIDNAVAKP